MRKGIFFIGAAIAIAAGLFVFIATKHYTASLAAPVSETTLTADIGQSLMIGIPSSTLSSAEKAVLEKIKPGGIILFGKNIVNKTQLKKLVNDLQTTAATYSHYPLLIAVDEEGGPVSRIRWIPNDIGEAQIADATEAYAVSAARAKELRDVGINVNLAPVLDAAGKTDFLYNRTFQKSPASAGELGAAIVKGQEDKGILSTIKHFPGYVGMSYDPESKLASVAVPPYEQFKTALAAHPDFIMTANVIYPSIDPALPFVLSPKAIQYVKMNLPGDYLIMSDDLGDPIMQKKFGIGPATVMATNAGVDVLLVAGWKFPDDALAAYRALTAAATNETISQETIAQHLAKIEAVKKRLVATTK